MNNDIIHSDIAVKKKTIDDWLDSVDYKDINHGSYKPTEFALLYMNYIKLVNGKTGEEHKTPPVHLKMLDKLTSPTKQIANLCFRGAAKTTLFFEYFAPFLAIFQYLPNFGELNSMIYVSDSMDNGVKSARKNIEFRYNNSEFLQEWLPVAKFTDNFIYFENKEGKPFAIKMFGAKTGLRGTKIFGQRPKLAVLDDLVGDDDADSKASMESIKNTVHKGVNYALHPTKRKIIFNGTPFNKDDILVEAVESGAWDVNVWPVCEKFPCSEEEFEGAWGDRFPYSFIQEQYNNAVLNGTVPGFMQELMLRISSEEERLVQDSEIREYSRTKLLERRGAFNFYITTDFATSEKEKADFNVISVWAYNSQGDWFWVDGVCERMTMDKALDHLFRLVQEYRPQSVGIEVAGQQGGFIPWIQEQMMAKNIWFSFASNQKSNAPGIKPDLNKLTRFNLIVPLFKAGKMYWPQEMKTTTIVGRFMSQIKLATFSGLKGKDDCLDTVSMLMYIRPWKPSEESYSPDPNVTSVWDEVEAPEANALNSYIV